jgi:hypothetical protein
LRHRDDVAGQPRIFTLEDRATLEPECDLGARSLESRASPRFRARAHLRLTERHRADAAWDVDRFESAARRKLTEDPAHGFDFRRIGRADRRRAEGERHAWTVNEADSWGSRPGI